MNDEPEKIDTPDAIDPTAIAEAMLAGKTPTPHEDYREHVLKSYIYPEIFRWGFEPRFHHERRTSFHPKQEKAYQVMGGKLAQVGAIVALVGIRGVGKTTLTAELAIETAWRNYRISRAIMPGSYAQVIYKKCTRLISRFKPLFADFGSIDTETLTESFDRLARWHEYLVIDEVHEAEDSKLRSRLLNDLIDRRYMAQRDTILIANQTAEDFSASIGDTIISRLNEHGIIIPCEWPSFREL